MAAANYFKAVQEIYIAYYQRPADPAGLRYWAERIDAAGGDTTAVIDAFATSVEAEALYGEITKDRIGEVIEKIYQALFGRAPDAGGKAFYEGAFTSGTMTEGNIVLSILNAAQNEDKTVIANKLLVANRFTETVDGRSFANPEFGTGEDFAYDYTEEGKAAAARKALANVNADPESILDNGEVKDVLDDKLPNPGDNETPGNGSPGTGNSAPTGKVSIEGELTEGKTLTASHSLKDADGLGAMSYQWLRNGEPIPLATGNEYILTQDDVDAVISVTLSYKDGKGKSESVTSAATGSVANVNDVPVLANDISNQSATQGQAFSFTLSADTFTDADGDALTYSAVLIDSDGQLVGDGSLPAWLTFDPDTVTFSGTPAHGDVGDILIRVVAEDAAGASASGVFTLEQIDQTGPANTTVSLAAADDTGLAGDMVTNKAAVALQVSGIEAGGRAWLDKDGNGVYDAGTDQLADGNGVINVAGLVVGNNNYKIISEDAAGNTSSTMAVVVRDTAAPNRDVETPVSVDAGVQDGVYREGDTITLMFGEAVKADTLSSALPMLLSGRSLGDGATVSATNIDQNGYATTFSITLGADAIVQAADTISFASTDVIDIAGNPAFDTVSFVLPDLADSIQPVFTSPETAAVNENQNQLYVAAATDGSTLTYSLKPGQDADLLTIDATTGVVTLASGDLDFEAKTEYSFTVIASDASANSSERTVTVNVNNLDEVAPTITSSDVAQAIDENSGAGQVVYTVQATDTEDVSGGIVYSLKADNLDDAGAFTIDGQTGEVTLTGDPDFEAKDSYTFTVVATDVAGLFSEKTVTLAITDVDDSVEKPVISLTEDTGVDEAAGSEITRNSAITLSNLESGATVEYSLNGGDDWLTGEEYELATAADGSYSVVMRQTDESGNISAASDALAFIKDTSGPAVASEAAIVSVDGSYASGNTFTLSFSEAVDSSLFGVADILVSNGHTLGSLTEASLVASNPDANGFATSFTLILGDGTLAEGDTLTIEASKLVDRAGNTTSTDAVFTAPDVTAPTFNAAGSVPGDNGVTSDVGQNIVLQFSEVLSDGSDLTKVYLKNVITDAVVDADIRIEGSSLVIDPAANLVLGEGYYVAWDQDALKDTAGYAVASAFDDTTYSFLAGGSLTGTVQEIISLTPAQLGAATSITVKDTALAISGADFSTGNLAATNVTTVKLAQGETENAYLSVADLSGRALVLDRNEADVTGKFVLLDSITALNSIGPCTNWVSHVDSFEIRDEVSNIFSGDDVSTGLSAVVTNFLIDKIIVTGGHVNLAQAQALQSAAESKGQGGANSELTYDLIASAAELLAASDETRLLIATASDVDVDNLDVGALNFDQLVELYGLLDEDASQPHDQQLTYSLLADVEQLFNGSELKDVASHDYLPNASSLTVTGATVTAATITNGDAGTAEVQALETALTEGSEYRLTVGGVTLRTDVLGSSTVKELVTQLQHSDGYGSAGFTVSAGEGPQEGKILVSWDENGDRSEIAELTTVASLSLDQATKLIALSELEGDDLTSVAYDLKLTAEELIVAWDGEDAKVKALLSGARDITIIDDMTVEQAGRLANIGNTGIAIYNIRDTAEKLASGAGVIEGARDLIATTAASASQAKAIYDDRGASGTLTFSVIDYIGNLVNDAYKDGMNAAVDIVSYWDWIGAAQAQKVVEFSNTGYTEFGGFIRDSVSSLNAFIDTNGAGSSEGNTLRPYTYRVYDSASNIAAAVVDSIDLDDPAKDSEAETTQHVLLDASLIEVSGTMTYEQASTLVNTLHFAKPTLLTNDQVAYTVQDTVANLENDRIWREGDAVADETRAIKYADWLHVVDTAANIAAAQNGNSTIDAGDREVFQRINEASGSITASGSDGSQTIAGSRGGDSLRGGEGYDVLYGNGGSDTLYGDNGNDFLYGGDDRDLLYAGTSAGVGTGNSYTGVSDYIYGGNGGDNMFGSGTSGYYDRDQFVYTGNSRDALRAESGTTTVTRDYISNMGYGDSIKFANVSNENVFFIGTANVVANPVEAGTLALSIGYDRNVQVGNWYDSGLVNATKVNVDIADANGYFDGVADMHIIVVGTNMDLNWSGDALVYGA